MERTVNTKFYTFRQNNSGGYFIINDYVAEYLIIEASSPHEAIIKMKDITENYSEFCACCGHRWNGWIDDEDGKEIPMIYNEDAKTYRSKWDSGEIIIYYYDETKEKLRYEER